MMLSDDAERLLAPFRAQPERSAVLFDLDGTLAPIVFRPEEVVVPDQTMELLKRLLDSYALVGFVSGRRAVDVRGLIGADGFAYAGNHGLEYLAPGAREPVLQQRLAADAEDSGAFARSAYSPLLREAGIRIEDKSPIWSFHWRGAADEQGARQLLERVAADAEHRGLGTHWGRKVLEVRPRLVTDKGTAIAAMLASANVEAALYAGDDVTDLDAFRKLRELRTGGALAHAVCVGVRSDEGPYEIVQEADLVVDGTAGVSDLLSHLVP